MDAVKRQPEIEFPVALKIQLAFLAAVRSAAALALAAILTFAAVIAGLAAALALAGVLALAAVLFTLRGVALLSGILAAAILRDCGGGSGNKSAQGGAHE
jgi:hypothetical protein